jgi:Xanthosine triphosphate pyrophosphatase
MQTINFITSNKQKIEWGNEIAIEYGYDIEFKAYPYDFDEKRSIEAKEIAMHKVEQAIKFSDAPFIVEDSGFYIDALNGFPATFVKFGLTTIGLSGIVKLMKDIKDADRTYSIKSAIGYGNPFKKTVKVVSSSSEGILSYGYVPGDERGWGEIMGLIMPINHKTTITKFDNKEWLNYKHDIVNGDAFSRSLGKILKIIIDDLV